MSKKVITLIILSIIFIIASLGTVNISGEAGGCGGEPPEIDVSEREIKFIYSLDGHDVNDNCYVDLDLSCDNEGKKVELKEVIQFAKEKKSKLSGNPCTWKATGACSIESNNATKWIVVSGEGKIDIEKKKVAEPYLLKLSEKIERGASCNEAVNSLTIEAEEGTIVVTPKFVKGSSCTIDDVAISYCEDSTNKYNCIRDENKTTYSCALGENGVDDEIKCHIIFSDGTRFSEWLSDSETDYSILTEDGDWWNEDESEETDVDENELLPSITDIKILNSSGKEETGTISQGAYSISISVTGDYDELSVDSSCGGEISDTSLDYKFSWDTSSISDKCTLTALAYLGSETVDYSEDVTVKKSSKSTSKSCETGSSDFEDMINNNCNDELVVFAVSTDNCSKIFGDGDKISSSKYNILICSNTVSLDEENIILGINCDDGTKKTYSVKAADPTYASKIWSVPKKASTCNLKVNLGKSDAAKEINLNVGSK